MESPPEWLLEQAIAEKVLVSASDRARRAGIDSVEPIAQNGDVARGIVDAARDHRIDTIVMGTRGLSDLQGLVLGSVAHKVTHAAPCTVVTVK